jgi:dihydrofolate synthase/folylpolyglutamate synthase
MDYSAAVDRLYALGAELHTAPGQPRRKFDLNTMRRLMTGLGDPQRTFDSVLIAGTNGKGSTAATLASIVAAAGYRTGLYTSPHLVHVNERIQILEPGSREAISDGDFAFLFTEVDRCAEALVGQAKLPHGPSFFEVVTAMAFLHFARRGVKLAVLEVGLGGRLDATNIVDPLVSVITDISLDHTEWLGPTIAHIAREKAGILRPGGTMVTLPQHPEANQALGEAAISLGAHGVNAAEYLPACATPAQTSGNRYSVLANGEVIKVESPLSGDHQRRNLALAIAAALEIGNNNGYAIDRSAIEAGIRQTTWPGRLERVAGRSNGVELLLDVAHNPSGAWALRAALSEEAGRPLTLVFGCLRDKPAAELGQILFPLFDRVILTSVDSPRSERLEVLQAVAESVSAASDLAPSVERALEMAFTFTQPGGLIVVAGSIFLVGRVRQIAAERGERLCK